MKEGIALKGKNQMPSYYGKNIVQHAQKRFLQRKAMENERKKQRLDDLRAERMLREAEKRTDEYERGERDHL